MHLMKVFLIILCHQDFHDRATGKESQNDDDGVEDDNNEDIDDENDNGNNDNASQAEALDAQGLPGWDKVDALARALIDLCGLSVSNEEARIIQELYSKLDEYDKRPLTFTPCPRPAPSRGRFGRCKKGHTTIDQMKRYVIYVCMQ